MLRASLSSRAGLNSQAVAKCLGLTYGFRRGCCSQPTESRIRPKALVRSRHPTASRQVAPASHWDMPLQQLPQHSSPFFLCCTDAQKSTHTESLKPLLHPMHCMSAHVSQKFEKLRVLNTGLGPAEDSCSGPLRL